MKKIDIKKWLYYIENVHSNSGWILKNENDIGGLLKEMIDKINELIDKKNIKK